MKWHYVNAFTACAFTVLWAYTVSEGSALLASANTLNVAYYVYLAEQARRKASAAVPDEGEG